MKNKNKVTQAKRPQELNFDKDYSKYYWLIIPLLTIIYFSYSFFSNGFYQDDEVAHFINMRDFWSNPWIIMSNWGKPGWKIFLVLPSLGGYKFVLFFNSLITAITAYYTIQLAKQLNYKNSIIAGIFFAFQPLVLQLSFRSYAEIFTGLLLILTLYFYFRNNFILSALMCGLSFTARQESALLGLILAIYFIIERKYIPIIFLGVFPFILNLLGYLHTGDPVWAWIEMKNLSEFNLGIERSFFHYFEVYIFITGPIVLAFLILGLIKLFKIDKNNKEFLKKELLIYLFFFIVFLFQCYLVIKGTNPGSWRYVLQVSPFASIIALRGFNDTLDINKNKYILPVLVFFILIVLLFLSRQATGLVVTEQAEYSKLIVLLLVTGGIFVFIKWPSTVLFKQFMIFIFLLTAGYTFLTEKPKQEGPENIAVDKIAEWYKQNSNNSSEVLYNHSLILFYANIFGRDKDRFKILNIKSLDEAAKGSIVIWDSHYSYRPEYKNDTKLESLQDKARYKLLNQINSTDGRFTAFIFEKL
jgi:hypothetical protein